MIEQFRSLQVRPLPVSSTTGSTAWPGHAHTSTEEFGPEAFVLPSNFRSYRMTKHTLKLWLGRRSFLPGARHFLLLGALGLSNGPPRSPNTPLGFNESAAQDHPTLRLQSY